MSASAWSTQQLAEFLAVVSSAETEAAAAWAAVERTAEELDAEVAAIVCGGDLLAAVGYPEGAAPVAELAAVTPGVAGEFTVPGLGVCSATAVRLEHPPGARLVVARCGTGLGPPEVSLLRGIAHASSITMRMLRLLDDERAARQDSTQRQTQLEQLANEQAALRRMATVVARGTSPPETFSAVAAEVGQLLGADVTMVLRYEPDGTGTVTGGWSIPGMTIPAGDGLTLTGRGVAVSVLRSGQPARTEHFEGPSGSLPHRLQQLGVRSGVGAPITVEGRLWGAVVAASRQAQQLPPGSESRIADFTELLGTAIANAHAREELRVIADEQAALRRVATLVAHGEPPAAVFAAVAEEVGQVLSAADFTMVGRYDPDRAVEVVGGWSRVGNHLLVGRRASLGGRNVSTLVFQRNQPARVDHFADDVSVLGVAAAELGMRSSVGAPISVEGRLWGVMIVGSTHEDALPAGTEHRLAEFTELVATAIANVQAREELRRVADEQAALRRVATLVARGEPPAVVFAAVAEEVGQVLPTADYTMMGRYVPDRAFEVVGVWSRGGDAAPVGDRVSFGGPIVTALVFDTGQPARRDSYADVSCAAAAEARARGVGSVVGVPISVEGHVWGVMLVAATRQEPLPPDTEQRLADFTELVATAIANAQAREELRRVADEQAGLRRVATLVARAAPPPAVFATVAEEVGRLLRTDLTLIGRYEPDGAVTIVASWGATAAPTSVGHRVSLGGRNVCTLVFETCRAARIDHYAEGSGPAAAGARADGLRSAVGAPISVAGRLWGVVIAASTLDEPLPADTEMRLAGFTELVATAIANAEAHAQLTASRARIVATVDETRRRIERDLHDGAQQRLVSLALQVRAAQATVPPQLAAELDHVAAGLTSTLEELREYARGIHPAILTEGGLAAALKTLARRSPVPVELDVRTTTRLPERIEVTAYYVVAEALTNAAKHANASAAHVALDAVNDVVRLSVSDDGIGGADPTRGSGLVGLTDRVEATGGTLTLHSRPGQGTHLVVELPVDSAELSTFS